MTPTKRIFCGLLILVSSSALAKGETPTNHHVATTIIENLEECSKRERRAALGFLAVLGGLTIAGLSISKLRVWEMVRAPGMHMGALVTLAGGLGFSKNVKPCTEPINAALIEGDTITLWNQASNTGLKCLIEHTPDSVHIMKTHFEWLTAEDFARINSAIDIKYDTCHAVEVLD